MATVVELEQCYQQFANETSRESERIANGDNYLYAIATVCGNDRSRMKRMVERMKTNHNIDISMPN